MGCISSFSSLQGPSRSMYAWAIPELFWLETRASRAFLCPASGSVFHIAGQSVSPSSWLWRLALFAGMTVHQSMAGHVRRSIRTRCTIGACKMCLVAWLLIFQLFHQFLLRDSIYLFGLFETCIICIIL